MNVTSKGYYTSKYLDNVTRNRFSNLPDNDQNQFDYFSRSQNGPVSPRTAMSEQDRSSSSSPRSRTPVSKTRTPLPAPKTPTQSINDAKGARQNGGTSPEGLSTPNSPLLSPLVRAKSSGSDMAAYDPDYLEQGITPADLHVLQSQHSRVYPYKAHRDMAVFSGKQVRQAPKYPHGDYYIKQKQRHDESSFKPKFYTHKTFKEVFDDEQGTLEKYNPMESVFDDPDIRKEQELNQKLKKALRSLQTKLGKDNYNDYDYYKNMNLSQAQKKDIFINLSNNENNNEKVSEIDLNDKIYVTEDEKKQLKRNKNFKNIWKNGLKKVSKDIRQDYSNSLAYLDEKLDQESVIEPIVLEPEEEEEIVEKSQVNVGANPEFHPLWNYILSWLVYDQTEEPPTYHEETINNKPKIRMLTKEAVKFDMKNIKNNYKGMVNKWGQPASTLFNSKQLNSRKQGPSIRTVPAGILDDLSQEFVIEVDDDYGDEYAREELYFDPTSKQLQANPPTSFSSMFPQGKFNRKKKTSQIDTSSGPVSIISNINTLIKNIKIMRIIFAPIDIIAINFPNLQSVVIMLELVIFLWILYELSLLVDALCMMVKAICAPMIAMGRFMNRIM